MANASSGGDMLGEITRLLPVIVNNDVLILHVVFLDYVLEKNRRPSAVLQDLASFPYSALLRGKRRGVPVALTQGNRDEAQREHKRTPQMGFLLVLV